MTERTQIIAIAVFMTAICAAALFGLNKCSDHFPDAGKVIIRDTLWKVTQLPPERDTVTATLTVIRKSRTTDTLIIMRADTLFRDLPPFSLRGDSFVTAKRDTIFAEYQFPANKFIYDCRYSPDTVIQITTREYIKPDKVQFGAQIGAGLTVGIDGVVRPGAFVGVGINYKF